MLRNSAINLVLKVGLGVTCIGFVVYSIFYPDVIAETYPQFMLDLIGDVASLIIGGLVALFMAAWIFSRKHKFACFSIFTFLIFIAIIANITSLRFLSVAWPLLVISFALMIRYYPRVRIIIPHKGGERMRIVPIVPDGQPSDKPATHDLSGSDAEDDIVEMEDDAKPVIEEKSEATHAPAPADHAATVVETAPEILENDPAKTNEFLNSENFVRGNKIMSDAEVDPVIPLISEEPTQPKAKRTYKPRARKAAIAARIPKRSRKLETDIDTGFSNSDSIDIHGNI